MTKTEYETFEEVINEIIAMLCLLKLKQNKNDSYLDDYIFSLLELKTKAQIVYKEKDLEQKRLNGLVV